MSSVLDRALGIHQQALEVSSRRLELLASNIANADTPNYKARDIDFRAALSQAASEQDPVRLAATRPGHIHATSGADAMAEVRYRVPNHASLDGNTVDSQLEHAAFAENAVRYQASLDFINSRISGLRKALKGE
ncbi:flagellar basal body rod protein FlgB [Thioalkalivibrio sp. XN8]|uniref:flagellar basal body rod protein FlgB n=1 Tax=Thioalkalivibrio sp. XN8 TaxID=2712863 RepID=UPI0013EA45A7|nr:flagellar basal body rod protein FlgB [Thioalkalivibrio sp. XN8]NGP53360.1 flagellar basal body rod protein FlgB [Thioalkalivibrio sp. XN8]